MKKIRNAFAAREKLPTLLISLLLGPVFGMLYLAKGWVALFYFTLSLFLFLMPHIASIGQVLSYETLEFELMLSAIHLAGMMHCYWLCGHKEYHYLSRWYSGWKGLLILVVLPVCVALLFRQYAYEPFVLRTNSMAPNYVKKQTVWVKKFAYRDAVPQRGDVIAFRNGNVIYIKRLVGMPDEEIQMIGGVLHINASPVDYVIVDEKHHQETLPEGRTYHVLNQTQFGQADHTALFHVPEGHYFVLGDNRDYSLDSRYSQHVGFIPKNAILGKVISLKHSH